jgi:hypothetical protein
MSGEYETSIGLELWAYVGWIKKKRRPKISRHCAIKFDINDVLCTTKYCTDINSENIGGCISYKKKVYEDKLVLDMVEPSWFCSRV